MKGHIRQRGKNSFELKFDAGRDPATGKRRIQYASFKGTKREAQIKLAALITSVGAGSYVEPSKSTVAEFVRARVDQWQAARRHLSQDGAALSATWSKTKSRRTSARSRCRSSRRLDIEGWHNALHQGGLAARTIGHAHRVLCKALSDAESDGLVVRNVCKLRKAPKVAESEMAIVQDVPGLVAKLRGSRLYVPAMLALFTGMRLGEVLALRWMAASISTGRSSRCARRWKQTKARHPLQGAEVQGRPPRYHPARYRWSRRCGSIGKAAARNADEARRRELPDDALLFANLEGAAPAEQRFVRLGRARRTHRYAGNHVPRTAPHPCQPVDFQRRGYCHHFEAPGPRQASVTLAIYAHMFTYATTARRRPRSTRPWGS